MPSKTEKQRRFFGAVLSAKEGKGGRGKAAKAAKGMSKNQIKDFLHKEEESRFDNYVKNLINSL